MNKIAFLALSVLLCAVAVKGQFGFIRNIFNPRRPTAGRPPQQSGGRAVSGCRPSGPNYSFQGKNYLLTNRIGCSSFTGDQAVAYCNSVGMKAINLDSNAKANHFIGLLNSDPRWPYFWTGGSVQHAARTVVWNRGISAPISAYRNFWSHTGGRGVPQPDNRERPESCLAVLKNVYNDGTRFHDVNCSHRKPTICEQV